MFSVPGWKRWRTCRQLSLQTSESERRTSALCELAKVPLAPFLLSAAFPALRKTSADTAKV